MAGEIVREDPAAGGLFRYRVLATGVVDGDTVDLELDLGFGVTRRDRFRLYGPDWAGRDGLNAPELNTPEGVAARRWLADALVRYAGRLVARTVKDRREKFGRYLVVLTVPNAAGMAEVNVNEQLVAAGHAVLKRY